jgi:hypothetical protein
LLTLVPFIPTYFFLSVDEHVVAVTSTTLHQLLRLTPKEVEDATPKARSKKGATL